MTSLGNALRLQGRVLWFVGLWLCASPLSGCGANGAESTAEAGQPLYRSSTDGLSGGRISVCIDDAVDAVDQSLVKQALSGARSWSNAGALWFDDWFGGCGN